VSAGTQTTIASGNAVYYFALRGNELCQLHLPPGAVRQWVKTFSGDIDDVVRELTEDLEVLPAGTYGQMASGWNRRDACQSRGGDMRARDHPDPRRGCERSTGSARPLSESGKRFQTTISHFEHDAEGNIVRALTTKPIPFNRGRSIHEYCTKVRNSVLLVASPVASPIVDSMFPLGGEKTWNRINKTNPKFKESRRS
jgi:hypothetical protein